MGLYTFIWDNSYIMRQRNEQMNVNLEDGGGTCVKTWIVWPSKGVFNLSFYNELGA